MNPIISILIITHNQRYLLERCLDSVLNQKIDDLNTLIESSKLGNNCI